MCDLFPSVTLYGTTQLTVDGQVYTSVVPAKTLYSACATTSSTGGTPADSATSKAPNRVSRSLASSSSSVPPDPAAADPNAAFDSSATTSMPSPTTSASSRSFSASAMLSNPVDGATASFASTAPLRATTPAAALPGPSSSSPTIRSSDSASASGRSASRAASSAGSSSASSDAAQPHDSRGVVTTRVAVGAAVGAAAALALCIILFIYIRRRKRQRPIEKSQQPRSQQDYWEAHFQDLEASGDGTPTPSPHKGIQGQTFARPAPEIAPPAKLHLSLNLLSDRLSNRTRLSALSGLFSSKRPPWVGHPAFLSADESLSPSSVSPGFPMTTALSTTKAPRRSATLDSPETDDGLQGWHVSGPEAEPSISASPITGVARVRSRTFGEDDWPSPPHGGWEQGSASQELTVEAYGQPIQVTKLLPPPRPRTRPVERKR